MLDWQLELPDEGNPYIQPAGWVLESEGPDYDQLLKNWRGMLDILYTGKNLDDLEDHIEEICAQLGDKLPSGQLQRRFRSDR